MIIHNSFKARITQSDSKKKQKKMAKRRGNKLKNTIGHKSACKVILTRLGLENENYKKALFEYHGIRDLRVVVKRLPNETVATNPQRMKLSSVSKLNSVRFHVPWLPTITSTKSSAIENTKDLQQLKSAAAKRSQSLYHDQAANDDESGKSHDGTLQKGKQYNLVLFDWSMWANAIKIQKMNYL